MFLKFKNRLNLARDFYGKRHTGVAGYPTEYVFEVSSKCNLRCKMCPIVGVTRPTGFMEPDVFSAVVSKVEPYAELVYLIGLGEPLYNTHFVEYLADLRRRDIPVATSTNCTFLTPDVSEQLLKNDLNYIIMPLDGIEKETYEGIRINANFETVTDNIRQFLALKKKLKSKTFVQLQMILMEENMQEAKGFKDFIKKLGAYDQVSDIRFKPLINFNDPAGWLARKKNYNPCFLLWRNMFISHLGEAFVCCQDIDGSVIVGDFKRESIETIMNSPRLSHFRKVHSEKKMYDLPLCQSCDLNRNYFTHLSVIGSAILPAFTAKKIISYYEDYIMKFFD